MAKPVLYLMVGYPGAGKTTVARLICETTGAVHLWADLERHTMFEHPTHTPEESRKLYDHLNHVTDDLLASGKSVVFDTNFNYHHDREHMRQIAQKNGADVVTLWLTTPKELARKRATEESHGKETRVWGNMSTEVFDHMSNQLQEPNKDEHPVKIDGTHIDPETVKQQLGL